MARVPASTTNADGTPKVRKTRSPAAPKKVYAIIRILDENGGVQHLPKAQVELVGFERSGEAVLEKIESGAFPGALYLRGLMPAGR